MIPWTRCFFLLVIGISSTLVLQAEVTPVCFKDTVLINGRVLSIKSSVQIDTLSPKPEKNQFRQWLDGAQFYSSLRMGKEIGGDLEIEADFFRVLNKTMYPEIALEVTHPVKESFQLFYKFGTNGSLVNRFNYNKLDGDVIGFNWDSNDQPLQIISIEDPLLNESDTLPLPLINTGFNVSVVAGLEWKGVMRGARGWIWGGQIEWSPLKPKRAFLFKPPSDPSLWDDVLVESTYDLIHHETNALKLRAYASWSPWRIPVFLRAELLVSKNEASSWVSVGYLW